MAAATPLIVHLPYEEVVEHFKTCSDPNEKTRWQAIMLCMEGYRRGEIASICKHERGWVTATVHHWNQFGKEGLLDDRRENGRACYLSDEQQKQLGALLDTPAPDGGIWSGKQVVEWIHETTQKKVTVKCGIDYLHRAEMTQQMPRPQHPDADPVAQETFKKKPSRPASRRTAKKSRANH
jgi:transposase